MTSVIIWKQYCDI